MMGTRGNVLLTAQQISFAKLLSGNDKKMRDNGLRKLRNYFTSRSRGGGLDKFQEDDCMRIWKGLYYCMWMSDKPLVQEDLAECISDLVHCFKGTQFAVLFMKTFFLTMGIEWFGIDQHRLDKFLMLVRRFLRQTLTYCQRNNWDKELVKQTIEMFSSTVLSPPGKPPQLGLTLHFIDIFPEELAKVGKGELPQPILLEFLRPFLQHLSEHDDERTRSHIVKHIFHHLMKQSDVGLEYDEKFKAWKQAGFPGESCEDMKRIDLEEEYSDGEDNVSKACDPDIKDPRAGKVDVTLPQLQFDAWKIAEVILEYARKAPALKSRKVLYDIAEQFSDMARGIYPLAFKVKIPEGTLQKKRGKNKSELWEAAKDLLIFEESLKNEDVDENEDIEEELDVADEVKLKKLRRLECKLVRCDSSSGNLKKWKGSDKILKNENKGNSESKKRKSDNSSTEEVKPAKRTRMELKISRCDSYNGKIKRSHLKGLENDHHCGSNSDDEILNRCSTTDNLGTNACFKEEKKLSSGTKIILKRKYLRNGAETIPPVMKKGLRSNFVKKQSAPLKNLRVSLTRWEVTDISDKSKQISRGSEETRGSFEEKNNPPDKAASSSTPLSTSSIQSATKYKNSKLDTSLGAKGKTIPNGTPGSPKKVNIALQMNKEQEMSDYVKAVKKRPSIPFDASRKPIQGVLKPSPFSSPINPFYQRTRRRLSNLL